jgi:hypothetical protein
MVWTDPGSLSNASVARTHGGGNTPRPATTLRITERSVVGIVTGLITAGGSEPVPPNTHDPWQTRLGGQQDRVRNPAALAKGREGAGKPPGLAAARRSASEMAQAALMSPMWLKAWGKLPSSGTSCRWPLSARHGYGPIGRSASRIFIHRRA